MTNSSDLAGRLLGGGHGNRKVGKALYRGRGRLQFDRLTPAQRCAFPMLRTFLRSKLHRATITAADPDYEGSISIDRSLCRAAELLEFEQVDVYDITNGARFTTYVIYGDAGQVQVNGAAAQLVRRGDLIIVAAYATLVPDEIGRLKPRVVLLGPGNTVVSAEGHGVVAP